MELNKVIDTANNGRDALSKILDVKPDVVVLDMIMGNYDGIYAVENIMKSNPLPIVLLSSIGNTDLSPILKALKLGAFDYLNKPADRHTRIKDIEVNLIA